MCRLKFAQPRTLIKGRNRALLAGAPVNDQNSAGSYSRVDRTQKAICVYRLAQIGRRAGGHARVSGVGRIMCRQHDHRNVKPGLRKRLDHIKPIPIRHLEIKNNTVQFPSAVDVLDERRTRAIDLRKEIKTFQQPVHGGTDRRVVINDRYSKLAHVLVFWVPQGCVRYQRTTRVDIRPWSNTGAPQDSRESMAYLVPMPRRSATCTSAASERTCIFSMMCARCTFTVFSTIPRRAAIVLLRYP